jgi:Glycosyltransferase like family
MLSVIICSVNTAALEKAKKNITATAGIEVELICIDNSSGQYGICEAYNKGAAAARYPYLCFVHEDVQFETYNWGQLITDYFVQRKKAGLIGVAGGDCISRVPSSWSIPLISPEINLIQHYKRSTRQTEHILKTNNNVAGSLKKVAALDGVFICTTKEVFSKFQFDNITFPGFHGYDIDYSMQVGREYDLYVTFEILISHFSEGNPDRTWLEGVFRLSNKWKELLPRCSVVPVSAGELRLHHWNALQVLIKHLYRLQYSKWFICKVFFTYSFTRFFHLRYFLYTFRNFLWSYSNKKV